MKFWLVVFAASLSFPLAASQGAAFSLGQGVQQAKLMTAEQPNDPVQGEVLKTNRRTTDGKIHFSFQDQEWSMVIPWFSDQAGFSLQNVERWPDGTFNLQDKDSYSALEALDQLNRSLAGLSEPFTLIRKRKMLMLKPLAEAISSELIDSVSPADLDRRGAFEVMSVMFDLGELDSRRLYDELITQVSPQNRDYYNSFSVSNQLQVRETGARLRNIRDIIETAKKKLADEKPGLITYKLKFQDAETFIAVVGAQLGIDEGKVAAEDGSISIIAEPLGNRLYVSGSKKMLDRFALLAKTVDSDPNSQSEELVIEQPFLRTYGVTVDPKLAYDLLSTMLEGSGARMQQDEMSGAITVLGRKADHVRVVESLDSVSDLKTKNFAIIALKKVDVAEALSVLQSIYRQSLSPESTAEGPVLMANSYLNQIIVSGSAMEVAEVRSIAEELDARYVPVENGPRTNTRIIPMTQQDQLRLAPALEDLLGTVGRSNPFNIIRPEQRKDLDDRIRRGNLQESEGHRSDGQLMQELLDGKPSAKRSQLRLPTGASQPIGWKNLNDSLRKAAAVAVLAVGADRVQLFSNLMLFQQADQATGLADGNPSYRPPNNMKSITGAPIEFRFKEYGLTVVSDDLDAVDDIQAAISEFLGESKEVQLPSFFELQHRNVQEMQKLLEAILGLSESPAGGDGGANPLAGMMDNMLPGGDLLDGLLGGDDTVGVSDLEGSVKFGADVRFNTLWVTGATGNDLSIINRLVEYWDRPEGETKPELFGKTRMIKVYHRDAAELVELVKAQRPEMIYNDQGQQGGKDNKEVSEMLKAVKSLTGGDGGSSSGDANAKQTVVLGADTANNMILVTGPQYMYDDILAIVRTIDVAPGPRATEVIPNVPNSQFLLDTLKNQYGGKLMVAGEESEGAPTTSRTDQQSSSSGSAQSSQDQARRQLQRALQQSVRGQQGRGAGAGGGGGGRGAGGGGAGGGGGRGGR